MPSINPRNDGPRETVLQFSHDAQVAGRHLVPVTRGLVAIWVPMTDSSY